MAKTKRNNSKTPKKKTKTHGPLFKYTEEQMLNAINAVKKGESKRSAAIKYGVPRVTLHNKIIGKYPERRGMGPPPVLNSIEEKMIVDWLSKMSKAGCPVTKEVLKETVAKLIKDIKRENPFTDDTPGRAWYEGFLKRNPEISFRSS